MKKFKVPLVISLIACLIISVFIIGVWRMGWFQLPLPEEIPDREIGMDKAMKENIFKQMSETSQESQLVSINASGQKNYDWQSIEDLLRRESDSMEIADYVALLQVVESMTEVHTDGAVTTDFEAIGQLAQRGYQGAYLTPAMANTCILYKEWVEDVVVAPKTHILFGRRDTEEQKVIVEHLKQEMLKAAMLDGILMNDNEILQNRKRVSQHVPDINIIYEQGEYTDLYLIQIGDKIVKIHPFNNPDTAIGKARGTLKNSPLGETQQKSKSEELLALQRASNAYAIVATLAISEDRNIQMVICFDDTELEIRARAYDKYLYAKVKKEGKHPKYLNLTASDLKVQFTSDDQAQMAEYTKWWGDYQGQISYKNYKDELNDIYFDYVKDNPQFPRKELGRLTPAQIGELDKKIKDPNYMLDMGDAS
ncbi:MAG: hypothetical protein FWG14_10470 [Peptococcaceae bacterium]|nr:hypothetical protein [Peptococcaceae bacterium]